MTEYDITRKSGPVRISDYDPRWAFEFSDLARRIRALVGSGAVRIDYIGSTAVPGLAAKDVVDVQITVADLDATSDLTGRLKAAGFRQGDEFVFDDFRSMGPADPQLRKLYMREPDGERRVHIHIRQLGLFNQRYSLLFRDYLRASPSVRVEYEVAKRRAAQLFPDSIDGYLFLKDPIFHIIYEAASLWAGSVGWVADDGFV